MADPRSTKILARTLYRDMTEHGLDHQQVLAVASELIAEVTADLQRSRATPPGRA